MIALEAPELLGLFLRAFSLLRSVSSFQEVETLLNAERAKKLLDLYEKSKDYANFLLRNLSTNLKTHQFIFFSEKELRDYIARIDRTAKIIRVFESKEVDLYLVKIKSFKLLLNEKENRIIGFFNFLEDLALLSIFMNNFYTSTLENIEKTDNELKKDVDNVFSKIKNDFNLDINKLKNEVSSIISEQKQYDIANTYCVSCGCCCSCDCEKGSCSCCCSCDCDLIHYIQAWDDAKNEILNKIDNFSSEIKKILENSKEKLKNDLDYTLIDLNNENSLMFLFIALIKQLLQKMSNEVPFTFLCAVLKRRIKKIRILYEFLRKNYYMKRVEKNKLYKDIKEYFYEKYNIVLTNKQISEYLSIIKRRYLKIFKYKIKGKWIYFIGWNPNKIHEKKQKEVV